MGCVLIVAEVKWISTYIKRKIKLSVILLLIIFCLNKVDVSKIKRCLKETSLHQQQFIRKIGRPQSWL